MGVPGPSRSEPKPARSARRRGRRFWTPAASALCFRGPRTRRRARRCHVTRDGHDRAL